MFSPGYQKTFATGEKSLEHSHRQQLWGSSMGRRGSTGMEAGLSLGSELYGTESLFQSLSEGPWAWVPSEARLPLFSHSRPQPSPPHSASCFSSGLTAFPSLPVRVPQSLHLAWLHTNNLQLLHPTALSVQVHPQALRWPKSGHLDSAPGWNLCLPHGAELPLRPPRCLPDLCSSLGGHW